MNRLHIHPVYCKGCHICVASCPKKALKAGEDINRKGYRLPVEADMSRCNGLQTLRAGVPRFCHRH